RAARLPGNGDRTTDHPVDLHQQVVLLLLVGDAAGDAGVLRLEEQGALAAGDAAGRGGDALHDVRRSALGAFVPQLVGRNTAGRTLVLVLLEAALGQVEPVGPVRVLEVVVRLMDVIALPGDERLVGVRRRG